MTKATIDTDKGVIEIELNTTGAPKAAANFI
jgi:cyclophilin family peptidyl-prolyl cis-trans isomerase